MNPGSKKRNLQLDILRGIAVILVMGRHLELPRPDGVLGSLVWAWWQIGWIGVDLFFVLSGFLIGGLLISELERTGRIDVKRFLIRRGLKIYPLYFVFIGYLLFMPTAKALLGSGDPFATFAYEWGRYWPNLLFLQNYIGPNPAGHTWTLAVEEHFYIMLPFAIVGLVALKRKHLLLPICLFAVPLLVLGLRALSMWTEDPFSTRMAATHLRLDALLFGVGIRAVAQYYPQVFAWARDYRLWLFLAGVLLWSVNLFIEPSTFGIRTIGLTGIFLGSACFLLAAYHTHGTDLGRAEPWLRPVVSGVAWIGVYSYGIYVWHVTAMRIGERVVGGRLYNWFGDSNFVWFISMICVAGGAVVVGVVASRLVEWPVLHLREKFFPSKSPSAVSIPVVNAPADAGAGSPALPPDLSPELDRRTSVDRSRQEP